MERPKKGRFRDRLSNAFRSNKTQEQRSEAAPSSKEVGPEKPLPPKQAISHTSEEEDLSLWNQAYESLRQKDLELVEQYEQLLTAALEDNGNAPERSGEDTTEKRHQDNRIDVDPKKRQHQLHVLVYHGLQQREAKKTKLRIFGQEYSLRDEVDKAAELVESLTSYIAEAVQASPAASLAVAGLSIALPLLKNPGAAENASQTGFEYVTGRMVFYAQLEPLVLQLPPNMKMLQGEVRNLLVGLYEQILSFQLKCVLRLFRGWLAQFSKDLFNLDDWDAMAREIKDAEVVITADLGTIRDVALQEQLNGLLQRADESCNSLDNLLSAAVRQMQLTEENAKGIESLNQKVTAGNEETKGQTILLEQIVENTEPQRKQIKTDLPVVDRARFDSEDNYYMPTCLYNSRKSVREKIAGWARASTKTGPLVLTGPAGTGKSTLARTFAHSFASQGKLGATYFFRRGDEQRNGTSRFFPTLAEQLAESIPGFRERLHSAVDGRDSAAIESRALEPQFKMLIEGPLKGLTFDKIILVDALDECARHDHIRVIVRLLSKLHSVLLTARDLPALQTAFADCQVMRLDQEFPEESKIDIRQYLVRQLDTIKSEKNVRASWPTSTQIDTIVALATTPSPFYLYASTLCLFVANPDRPPRKQLDKWLQQAKEGTSQLDQIYQPIFQEAFGEVDADEMEEIRSILGAVILSHTPLSPSSLAALLDLDESDVRFWLGKLYAVLHVPSDGSPIQLLHKSFSDYLLDEKNTSAKLIHVDEKNVQAMLTSHCFSQMSRLDNNICKLEDPAISREEIDEKIILKHIPMELRYACESWIHHIGKADISIVDGSDVHQFLMHHFLHWIEGLALIGRVTESLGLIKILQSQTEPERSIALLQFLDDATRFLRTYVLVIDSTPLQLYSSLLLFAPKRSEVRNTYQENNLDWICLKPNVDDDWNQCIQTLEGHSGMVFSVAFSPNSTLIASASSNGTVRIWRADTGECTQTLKGHSNWVMSVAFSPNSALVASASIGGTVRIWRADTGECTQTLGGYEDWVTSIAFSPDSALIALASRDKTVRIWRANTGECMQIFEGHSNKITSVVFSSDSALIASASTDRTVRIWRANTGECTQIRNLGPILDLYFLSFSPGNSHLLTNVGAVPIDNTAPTLAPALSDISGYGLSLDRRWITLNGSNLLWLPIEYRPWRVAISGPIIILGTAKGEVNIIRFARLP